MPIKIMQLVGTVNYFGELVCGIYFLNLKFLALSMKSLIKFTNLGKYLTA